MILRLMESLFGTSTSTELSNVCLSVLLTDKGSTGRGHNGIFDVLAKLLGREDIAPKHACGFPAGYAVVGRSGI